MLNEMRSIAMLGKAGVKLGLPSRCAFRAGIGRRRRQMMAMREPLLAIFAVMLGEFTRLTKQVLEYRPQ
ncbi:hypothetical protein AJ88_37430 [Mesorhizobium amorphae CCBAU 01583]|nr:hypothetical protein AJ88_37430 [Mesorhizobium amorphae CCBAU 01583]